MTFIPAQYGNRNRERKLSCPCIKCAAFPSIFTWKRAEFRRF